MRRPLGCAVLRDGTVMHYAAYMASTHWRDVQRRYRASKLPQWCLVCGSEEVDLHHRTYKRLGQEWLMDLVPLCRAHHQAVHAAYDKHKARQRAKGERNGGLWGFTKRYAKRRAKKKVSTSKQPYIYRCQEVLSGG